MFAKRPCMDSGISKGFEKMLLGSRGGFGVAFDLPALSASDSILSALAAAASSSCNLSSCALISETSLRKRCSIPASVSPRTCLKRIPRKSRCCVLFFSLSATSAVLSLVISDMWRCSKTCSMVCISLLHAATSLSKNCSLWDALNSNSAKLACIPPS